MSELNKELTWLDNLVMYIMLIMMLMIVFLYDANRQYKNINTVLYEALDERVYYVSKNTYDRLTKNKGTLDEL